MKKIKTNPSRGDIYDCIFGNYVPENPQAPDGPFRKDAYDNRIPNEIRKRRPVVIVGERKKQYLVVPVSTTEDRHKKAHRTGEDVKLHIRLAGTEIPETERYKHGVMRWAKTDLLQAVDEERLREFLCTDGIHRTGKVSPELLRSIQEGVVRAIGLTPWLESLPLHAAAHPVAHRGSAENLSELG